MNNTIKMLLICTAAVQVAAAAKSLPCTKEQQNSPKGIPNVGNCSTMKACESDKGDTEKRDNTMCQDDETCANWKEGVEDPKTEVNKIGCVATVYWSSLSIKSGYLEGVVDKSPTLNGFLTVFNFGEKHVPDAPTPKGAITLGASLASLIAVSFYI